MCESEKQTQKQTFRTANFDGEFARAGALRVDGEGAVILTDHAVAYSGTGNADLGRVRRTVHFHRERTSCNHRTVILAAIITTTTVALTILETTVQHVHLMNARSR